MDIVKGFPSQNCHTGTFFQIMPMFRANGWGTQQAATIVGAQLVLPCKYNADPLVNRITREKYKDTYKSE